MGFIDRLEKNIVKLEKKKEKEQTRIAQLEAKCENKKITKAEFNLKKRHHDERIHAYSARIRVLQGGIVREKQHIENKAEEKEKKKEEKEKKKEKKVKREKKEETDKKSSIESEEETKVQ
ncbi:hypothetical protein AYK25_08890 [Thermoplasmatales archaeon SM1-50]|nr:MAG: hypothetical protein AYK25_08890 [Thermoplasmatales archaeon SM1-50]